MRKNKRKGIWIPDSILELNLSGSDKILLSEIYALCARENGCYVSNKHFADLLLYKTASEASKRITFLRRKGYIRTKLVFHGNRCIGRKIYKNKMMDTLIGILPNRTNGNDNWKGDLVQNELEVTSVGNTINSDTSTSILDDNLNIIENETRIKEIPIQLKPSTTTLFQFYKKQKEESASFLTGATKIKSQIFEFDSESRFNKLEKLIGNEELEKIKPALRKWILAKNQLK